MLKEDRLNFSNSHPIKLVPAHEKESHSVCRLQFGREPGSTRTPMYASAVVEFLIHKMIDFSLHSYELFSTVGVTYFESGLRSISCSTHVFTKREG